jgi:hypothetical protein
MRKKSMIWSKKQTSQNPKKPVNKQSPLFHFPKNIKLNPINDYLKKERIQIHFEVETNVFMSFNWEKLIKTKNI